VNKAAALRGIQAVAASHSSPGWNGERAKPVSALSARMAEVFIGALPGDIPLPEIAAEPDGSIAFDWFASRERVFSLSVGETGRLAYAWHDGADQGHGVVTFDRDTIPAPILDGVRLLFGLP
jgi:hypothetical protein